MTGGNENSLHSSVCGFDSSGGSKINTRQTPDATTKLGLGS